MRCGFNFHAWDKYMPVVKLQRRHGVVTQGCDVYIGRRMTMGGWNLPQSIWANPFKVTKEMPVDKACLAYFEMLCQSPQLLEAIPALRGKVLGCWCKKKPTDLCHGDILDWLANGTVSPALAPLMEANPQIRWAQPQAK
jgi:hypothetical protein